MTTGNPADAARRALREARQRAEAERAGAVAGSERARAAGAGAERAEADAGAGRPGAEGAGAEAERAGTGAEAGRAGMRGRSERARTEAEAGRAGTASAEAEWTEAEGAGGAERARTDVEAQRAGESGAERAGEPGAERPGMNAAAERADATVQAEHEGAERAGAGGAGTGPVSSSGVASGRASNAGGRARPGSDAGSGQVAEASGQAPVGSDLDSGPVSKAGTQARPGDVAREALRAARRGARRAEAGERESGRGSRTPARPALSSPRRGSVPPSASAPPGEEARAARVKAVQEMRQFLRDAFRMPTESDTPAETDTTGTPGGPDEVRRAPSAGISGRRSTGQAGPDADSEDTAPAAPAAVSGPRPAGRATPRTDSADTTSSERRASARGQSRAAETEAEATPYGTDPARPSPGPRPRTAQPRAAAPHVPSTMAAPHRDTELRRTFPAFAPRAGGEDAPFAATWWGNAWVDALERGALDPKRLARGRGYADQGHVDAITVTPGLVLAYVRGSRPRPYRVQVRVRTLEDEDWARFLDAAADRPGHIAALLDKELPQSLADCGVPLLPGPGDLAPRCSCPDSGHPCKHAAALCYQTARLLDADPFVLLLLRGRGERELLDALSRRSAARAARAAQERQPESLPGVRAAEALAPRELPPLPRPLPVPPHPEQPPAYPAAPGGPDPFALDQLATDAAARAHALLATGRDPVGELTLWQDAVRLAAARPGSGLTATTRTLYATLAKAVGRTPADLARAVAAWRQGGLAGLAVLEEPWDPPAGRFDRARPQLLAADLPAFRPWRNRLTHPRGHVQLRLGREGLWYAYESEPGQEDWWPRGTPDLDPVGALTGLGTLDDA